jgi:hypothetical protein
VANSLGLTSASPMMDSRVGLASRVRFSMITSLSRVTNCCAYIRICREHSREGALKRTRNANQRAWVPQHFSFALKISMKIRSKGLISHGITYDIFIVAPTEIIRNDVFLVSFEGIESFPAQYGLQVEGNDVRTNRRDDTLLYISCTAVESRCQNEQSPKKINKSNSGLVRLTGKTPWKSWRRTLLP